MTAEDVHRRLCESYDEFLFSNSPNSAEWQRFFDRSLVWLRGVDPLTAFHGLLGVLGAERQYVRQFLAGELLAAADLPCPLSLHEFVSRVSANWNVSVAAVPRYAARAFGRESVLNYLSVAEHLDRDRTFIDGWRYWLGATS